MHTGLAVRNSLHGVFLPTRPKHRIRIHFKSYSSVRLFLPSAFLFAMLFVPSVVLSEERSFVCAVLPTPGGEASVEMADVLESELADTEGITLLNRDHMEELITERILISAFKAEGVKQRVELGRMLKADLLVFLYERKGQKNQMIELAIAETRQGLRVATHVAEWKPHRVGAIAEEFKTAIMEGQSLLERDDLRIFAVTPVETGDLDTVKDNGYRGYTRLVEEYLLGMPGVVVVELAEAEALAREQALSAVPLQRNLPCYLRIAARSAATDEHEHVRFTIDLRRGTEVLRKVTTAELDQDQIAQALQDTVSELAALVLDRKPSMPMERPEPDLLALRGDAFRRIGAWADAVPLYQSALLLDPTHDTANLRLFEWYTDRMASPGDYPNEPAGYKWKMRIRYAERAYPYLAVLLHEGQVSDGLCSVLTRFRAYGHLKEYLSSSEDDPQKIMPAYQRVCRRQTELVLDLLADNERRERLTDRQFRNLAYFVSTWAYSYGDVFPEQALEAVQKLLEIVSDRPEGLSLALEATMKLGQNKGVETHYAAFLDRLAGSDAKGGQRIAQAARIIRQIKDPETLSQALDELNRLTAEASWDEPIADQLEQLARDHLKWVRGQRGDFAKVGKVMLPRITPLAKVLKVVDVDGETLAAPSSFHDWCCCGPDMEVVATNAGVFVLRKDSDNLAKLLSDSTWRVHWDGRYVWALTQTTIAVLDLNDGKLLHFDEIDLGHPFTVKGCQLATIGPGRACFVGHIEREKKLKCTVATILEVQRTEEKVTTKRAKKIYEARDQEYETDEEKGCCPNAAFVPLWAMTMPAVDTDGGPWVVVGRAMRRPLILDLSRLEARVSVHRWPSMPTAAWHDGWLYIAHGHIGQYKESSRLHRARQPHDSPEWLIDFGERESPVKCCLGGTYYETALVHDNRLHLISGGCKHNKKAPGWVAVDLENWRTFLVVDVFPDEWVCCNHTQKLCRSNRFGLVLLVHNKPNRLELPPVETWPSLEVEVRIKGASASTTQAESAPSTKPAD